MLIILGEFLNFSNNSGLIRYFFVMTNKNQLGLNFFFKWNSFTPITEKPGVIRLAHMKIWPCCGPSPSSWGLHLVSHDFKMAASLLGLRTLGSEDLRTSSFSTTDLQTLGLTKIRRAAGYGSTPGPITEANQLSHWLRHRSYAQSWTNQCPGAGLRAAQNLG